MIKTLLTLTALLGLLSWAPAPAYAFDLIDPGGGSQEICGGERDVEAAGCVSRTDEDPLSGTGGVILRAAQIVGLIAGFAAVIAVVYSGIKYITSSGDPQKMGNAKGTLINALVGLIIITLAEALLMWFVRKL